MAHITNENIEELAHDFVCRLLDIQDSSNDCNDNRRVVVKDDDDDDDDDADDVVVVAVVCVKMEMMMDRKDYRWLNEHLINSNLAMKLSNQQVKMNVWMLMVV